MVVSKFTQKSIPFLLILCTILLGSSNLYSQVINVVSQNSCSTIQTSEVHIVDDNSGELFSASYPAGNFTFILSSPDASYTQSNNTGVFIGIPDGMNYFVIVHDNINNSQYQCPSTFEIYTDNSPIIEVYLLTQPICPDDSVVYQVSLICGAAGNATYYFSNPDISLSNNNGIFTGVNGGTFYAEDASGTMSNTVVMDSPFMYDPLSLAEPIVTQNCDSTGVAMISAQATGGDGNYTYYIIDVATGVSEQSTTGIFYVNEGSFYVGVSDGSGCNHQCPQLTIIEPCCQLIATYNVTDILCPSNSNNNTVLGSILLDIYGGTAPYIITDNQGNIINSVTTTNSIVIDNLNAGMYSFNIIDDNGCTYQTGSIFVAQPEDYAVEVIGSSFNCNTGLVDVTIEFSGHNPDGGGYFTWAYGSTPTITTVYGLTPGDVISTIICPDITLEQCPGDISFTVPMDSLNSFVVEVDYDYCPSNSVNSADNGNTTFTFTGGTAPYYVSSATTTYSSTDNSVLIENLAEGVYTFAAYDAQGCTQNIVVTIEQPEDYAYEILDYSYDCLTGLADLTVEFSGYNPDGGGYYLWGHGSVDAIHTFEGVTAGEVIITTICPSAFLEACPAGISINVPTSLSSFEVEYEYEFCPSNSNYNGSNGNTTFTFTGGVEPYILTEGNNTYVGTGNTILVEGLAEGTYLFNALDATGCYQTVTVIIEQPEDYAVEVIDYTYDCSAGLVDVTVEFSGYNPDGGGYFTWAYGSVDAIHTITGLTPGETITTIICPDITLEACPADISFTVPVDSLTSFEVEYVYEFCPSNSNNNFNNGNTIFTFIGGVAPFSITNNNTVYTDIGNQIYIDNLTVGTHTFVATDASGCSQIIDVIIEQPEDYGYEIIDYLYDCNTGLVDLTVEFSGHNPDGGGYYLLGYGSIDAIYTFEGLIPGEVISTTICPAIFLEACPGTITIDVPYETVTPFEVLVTTNDPCPGDPYTGSATFEFFGGGSSYTIISPSGMVYSAALNSTIIVVDSLAAGVYDFFASDGSSCEQIIVVSINDSAPYTTNIIDYYSDCTTGLVDVIVEFSGYNPDGGGYYILGYGDVDSIHTFQGLTPGETIGGMICPAINLEQCPGNISFVVPDDNQDAFNLDADYNCEIDSLTGNIGGQINLYMIGGQAPYVIIGSDGSGYTTMDQVYTTDILSDGIYSFVVYDMNGCSAYYEIAVNCSEYLTPPGIGFGSTSITLFPNPILVDIQLLKISYDIIEMNSENESYHFAITELATGREIGIKYIENTKGTILLNISNYPVGSFVCTLYPSQRNRVVNSQQFIVHRK